MTVSLIIFIAAAMLASRHKTSELDDSVADWFASIHSSILTDLFKAMTALGSTVGIIAITLLLAVWFAWKQGWKSAVLLLAGVAGAYVVNTLAKSGFDRARPAMAWGIEADGSSFPSGNAMLAIVMYSLAAAWVIADSGITRTVKWITAMIAILLIILMGASRLYFSVHYATDIIGGYAAGFVIVCLVMALARGKRLSSR
ncbi:phosphatase PAP2 family protein [Paenibacillus sp. JDR-2]|uniref:phosphatase PAP2 family protein n=1 Tax=Paenibacillus sp. (strain JDR-2) TaxID=324057 RepID=UPI000166637B|nr:phosphatase PAP2 family protein [Paenibacillus sp. JDR-2]ACT01154.1 phosphoesterase PA-phosphatase related [Paenibacillus sp. JDR-2]